MERSRSAKDPLTGLRRDFRIPPDYVLGNTSLRRKAEDNLAAIALLKNLEKTQRVPREPEQEVLVRYSGWGALPQMFHPEPGDYGDLAEELRALLTEEEYASARASTPNAHYTSLAVIQSIWHALLQFELTPPLRILEPAIGVGHFFGAMPAALYKDATRIGIEIDSVSARIAQFLYPDSAIRHAGFETVALRESSFDLVIGNVPFGNYPVYDPNYRHLPAITRSIHDYFIARSVALVRPGGLIALITSRYTLDKRQADVRTHIGKKADLLAAVRLPNTTFRSNAGTQVTTDVLFLRRRQDGQRSLAQPWLETASLETPQGIATVNEYFVNQPHHMLGTPAFESTQFATAEFTLNGTFEPGVFTALFENTPACYEARAESLDTQTIAWQPGDSNIKDGAYGIWQNRLVVRNGNALEPVNLPRLTESRIRGLLSIQDLVREVLRTQLEHATETVILHARRALNAEYDRFVYRYGPISSKENFRAFAGDPDHPLLLSLEDFDPESQRATKTAIFRERTISSYSPVNQVDSASEALVVSLNETGRVDWERIAALTGRPAGELQAELTGLVFLDPETNEWETADAYLSGDVRHKLRMASEAAKQDERFFSNVKALREVQPKDLEPGEIDARLGSPWLPAGDIEAFLCNLLAAESKDVTVAHAKAIASWTVELSFMTRISASNTTTYGTARFTAANLIELSLNNRTPTAYDKITGPNGEERLVVNQNETLAAREKQQQLKDLFAAWIWQDSERAARLARKYNDQYNCLRLRTYDGSHLTFPGMSRTLLRGNDLAPHQKNAVWRILQSDSALIGHVVGAGKTFTLVTAAMELRRLGIAQKTMFVVPNHLVEQWAGEFLKLYPQANLYVAGKDQFATGNRQRAMARIATGNYDAVIVSFKSFEFLPLSDETYRKFVEEDLAELSAEIKEAKAQKGDNRRTVKQLETAKKRLAVRFAKRSNREAKDNTVTFEDLGITQLMVDESDAYKNLGYSSKMDRIAGLPNSDSFRAFDMHLKIRYLRTQPHTRIVFATGTPISNTLAEMYTVLRYLAPKLLVATGTSHFDAWAASFGEAVTALELAPDGSGYRMNTRFAKFINMPELLTMFRTVADIQTAEMLQLPRPALLTGKALVEAAEASSALKEYIESLVQRATALKKERIDPSIDNMLKITGDGRKAALDLRLVGKLEIPGHRTKIDRALELVFSIWQETAAMRGTQLVFCDLSTPDPARWNVYQEFRRRLISSGIPEREIAFIHDADSDAKKKQLFDAVNAGRVRVLMGSTEKMGAGTNVQRRLVALTHLDAPWRPRDIEQREGRILRQGNENATVRIFRHVTRGSFDAYMWQLLEVKARFIAQIMSGEVTTRRVEDVENSAALTFAEIKAIASGNPLVMEKVKVDTEIRKLDALRAAYQNQLFRTRCEMAELPYQIERARQLVQNIAADIELRNSHSTDTFTMRVGPKEYSGKGARETAANALAILVLQERTEESIQVRAHFRGFQILSKGKQPSFLEPEPVPFLSLRGKGHYEISFNPTQPLGTIQSIEYAIRSLEATLSQQQTRLQQLKANLLSYQQQIAKPFEHEERLRELIAKQTELDQQLDLHKSDEQAVVITEPTPE